ncbi:MAG: hypothetical protein WCV56_07180 [Candidatus Omnitrophota bacterium]
MKTETPVFLSGAGKALFVLLLIMILSTETYASGENGKRIRWVRSKTGLSSLMTLSKDRDAMAAEYRDETRNYESIRKDLDAGLLSKGMRDKEIIKKYGKAVIVIPESENGTVRWVYKPGEADHSKGPKVYLFFGFDGILESWKTAG